MNLDRFRALLDLPETVASVHASLASVRGQLDTFREQIGTLLRRDAPPPPSAFVAVLVTGKVTPAKWAEVAPLGKRSKLVKRETRDVMLGDALELQPFQARSIELRSEFPMTDVRVVVFADLRRVAVDGIYVGTRLCAAAMSPSLPCAIIDEWPLGVWLRVNCALRKDTP